MADKVTSSLAEAKVLVMQGMKGDTGYSPTVSVQDITEPIPGGTKVIGHTVTITDATGAHSFNVMNGEDGEGGGGSCNPDEELAKSFQLTVSGTTVTLNDTAVNVSAAIQSARPVLFYTVSGGSFTFFGVSGMDYETGEIRLTTLFDGSGQTVTLAPSGSTMTGTLETTDLSAEVASLSRLVYALSVSGTTATLAASFSDFYAQYSKGLTPIIYLPYGGGTTDPIAMEMRVAYVDALERSIALVGEHSGSRYTVTLTQSGITMVGTLVATPLNELPAVTAADNGKSLVVDGGEWKKGDAVSTTPRVAMTASDTTPTLDPNKLYVFPEMATLTPTFATPTDSTIVNEYHFIFTSGATATTLTLPASVLQPDGFTVETNHVYEASIMEGNMTAQGWAVSV